MSAEELTGQHIVGAFSLPGTVVVAPIRFLLSHSEGVAVDDSRDAVFLPEGTLLVSTDVFFVPDHTGNTVLVEGLSPCGGVAHLVQTAADLRSLDALAE